MSDLDCPFCWGLGEAIREDRASGKLFCWPCPAECPSRSSALVRVHNARRRNPMAAPPAEGVG